jgi:hypothetical protein
MGNHRKVGGLPTTRAEGEIFGDHRRTLSANSQITLGEALCH